MIVLERFEKRLEEVAGGSFGKAFRGVVHPVEILNAMQAEADALKAILAGGRVLVPNRYVIQLSPYDHSRLATHTAVVAQELAQAQADYIAEQGWTVYNDVIVEIERRPGLEIGLFQVTAEVCVDVDPGPDVAPDAGPSPQFCPNQRSYTDGPAAAPRNARLVSSAGRVYPLPAGSTVIGRGSEANLRLFDAGVSRRHARLDFDRGQARLTDLNSRNGTAVNGQRISTATLSPGDAIQLGATILRFSVDD